MIKKILKTFNNKPNGKLIFKNSTEGLNVITNEFIMQSLRYQSKITFNYFADRLISDIKTYFDINVDFELAMIAVQLFRANEHIKEESQSYKQYSDNNYYIVYAKNSDIKFAFKNLNSIILVPDGIRVGIINKKTFEIILDKNIVNIEAKIRYISRDRT